MIGQVVTGIAIGCFVCTSAFRCECRPLTGIEQRAHAEAFRRDSVKLNVLSFRIAREADESDSVGKADVQVIEQPQSGERFPQTFVLTSFGGDENANCGQASLLFTAVSYQRDIRVLVQRSAMNEFKLRACEQIVIDLQH